MRFVTSAVIATLQPLSACNSARAEARGSLREMLHISGYTSSDNVIEFAAQGLDGPVGVVVILRLSERIHARTSSA